MAALAADAAEEAPRASMMAAPRLATVGMNSFSSHAWSPTSSAAFFPSTSQWNRSGYCVVEWLPQMVMCLMDETGAPTLAASWLMARLWSRRVIAVKRPGSMPLALRIAMSALVLAGLPTTSTLQSALALAAMALPCTVKMAPLAESRSARSMPALRGMAPMRRATSASPKATSASSVFTTSARSGKAQSSSSIATPSSALSAGVTSSSCRMTGWSGPSIWPLAMRGRMA